MDSMIRFKIESEMNIAELVSLSNIIMRRIAILQRIYRVPKIEIITPKGPKIEEKSGT